ncbi:GIN domain-containing protein [Terrabacter carboxydivorans]|uniref:Putative auto-transporter adhesin head GIN domain-containing protein n=1 Tax=Terrabacter carboxydivorans TaxID=619730 RepID=A0ABN3KMX0_9MICO
MRSTVSRRTVGASALLSVLLAALLAACNLGSPGGMVVGSGDVGSQARDVAAFTEVSAGAGIQVRLATGPRTVVVTAQPNIRDITRTEVSGSRLTVDTTSGYVSAQGLVVAVTVPKLDGVELSGGASASGPVGTSERLVVRMSGGARATLSGSAGMLELTASGGALPELGDLHATDATVDLSGGVVGSVTVSGTLKGTASGGVVLTLTRRPATTSVETSGGAVLRNP